MSIQISWSWDHEIISYSCSNSTNKVEETKKWEKFSELRNGTIKRLQIGTGLRDYKSGQEGLQIGAALGISNRGKMITGRGRDFKLGRRDFKLGQRLQIGARGISNRRRDYKSVQNSWTAILHCLFVIYFLSLTQGNNATIFGKH